MPTLQKLQGLQINGVSIAGHAFSAGQVREFLRGSAIVVGFLLFSYLALVTFPKLAASRANTDVRRRLPSDSNSRRPEPKYTSTVLEAPSLSPSSPFAPRPPPGSLRKTTDVHRYHDSRSSHILRERNHSRQVATTQIPSPQLHNLSPTEHLHRIADAIVGAHPTAARFPHSHASLPQQMPLDFPWVPAPAAAHSKFRFGLVQAKSGHRAVPHAAALYLSWMPKVIEGKEVFNRKKAEAKRVRFSIDPVQLGAVDINANPNPSRTARSKHGKTSSAGTNGHGKSPSTSTKAGKHGSTQMVAGGGKGKENTSVPVGA
ncbi:hypothetical protein C8R43DRAFT_1140057 [Mycena crocata]|nr:hypothetical protein C8R43DRAFT_1140057 [Mycena crocata]